MNNSLVYLILLILHAVSAGSIFAQQQFPPNRELLPSAAVIRYVKADFKAVFDKKIPSNVKYIALGEFSHGGYEPIVFKSHMVKYLVEERGVREILFEASDAAYVREIRNYLNNDEVLDRSIIANLIGKLSLTKAMTLTYEDLFFWLKQYNLQHRKDRVQVIGFDLGDGQADMKLIVNQYLIPSSSNKSSNYLQILNPSLNDEQRVGIINKWFVENQSRLKKTLDKDSFTWLGFYIRNVANGIKYFGLKNRSLHSLDDSSNLFRDSVMSDNILSRSSLAKSIIWAHSGHLIASNLKYMGTLLTEQLGDRYFVMATDFAKHALVEVIVDDTLKVAKKKYVTKMFTSEQSTAARKGLDVYGCKEGIFFRQDILNLDLGLESNVIDANGKQLRLLSSKNPVDVLVVFENVYPIIP